MTDLLDTLLTAQQEKLKRRNATTFWGRNKKLLIVIGIVLTILWVITTSYVYYWLPRVYGNAIDNTIVSLYDLII